MKGKARTLLVTDLDGTLLGPDALVSPRSKELISALTRRGAAVTVATARTPATVVPLLEGMLTAPPAVVMTGAAMWDRRAMRYVNPRPLPERQAREITELLTARSLEPLVYTFTGSSEKLHVWHASGRLCAEGEDFVARRAQMPLKEFHLGCAAPEGACVMLLFAMGPAKAVFSVAQELRARGDCSVSAFTDIYGPDTGLLEVFGAGVDKASALLRLKELTGAERMVVYGDNLNDLPMFAVADEAVAVANAVPAVLEAAHRVIGPNSADAVALDMERVFAEWG